MKSWNVAVCERLGQQLQDNRDPSKVRHSLISQFRTLIIKQAQGWDDLIDTQPLSEDPAFQLACSDQRSTTPLAQQRPSQPTLSRLLNLLAQDANRAVLHDGLLDLAMWRLSSMRGGKPLLREGNSGNAAQADQWIPGLVQRIRQTTGTQAQVRFDSNLPEAARKLCFKEQKSGWV